MINETMLTHPWLIFILIGVSFLCEAQMTDPLATPTEVPPNNQVDLAPPVDVEGNDRPANNNAVKPKTNKNNQFFGTIETPEDLTMSLALQRSFKSNPDLYARRLNIELSEISYDNAWAAMFMPTASLTTAAVSSYSFAQIPGSTAQASGKGALDHGTPTTAWQLNVGSYNLFNFFRDHDTYSIAKLEIERQRQTLREIERQVRFNTITAVFNLKAQQDLLDIIVRSVESAEEVFELIKSRIPLKLATESDLSSAEVDLLNAKNELVTAQSNYNQALWSLNYILGDTIGHPYNVRANLKYIKFKMLLEDVVNLFNNNAPALKDARKTLEQSRISLRLAEKNVLPLPTLSFSGVSVGQRYSSLGTTQLRDSTLNSGNIGVSLALNLTLPLVGSGGILNQRTLRAAEIQTEQAELSMRNAANQGEVQVRNQFFSVVQLEKTIQNSEKLFQDSLKVFEASLANLQNKSATNRLDLKDAIRQLRTSELQYTQSILQHYSAKLTLANLIGVDRFPEENL